MTATLADLVKAALAASQKKDSAAAVHALEDALALARKDAPLEIRAAAVINHDHTGIGLYAPAKNDAVEGRRLRLYVEVANHVLSAVLDGKMRAQLDVSGDFTYEDATKAPMELVKLQTVSLGTQSYETRTPTGVTSFGVEINLGEKSPAGTYHVALHVKDAVGNKSATRDVRFVLV